MSDSSTSEGIAVVGNTVAAMQAALTLAKMGVKVNLITSSTALGCNDTANAIFGNSTLDQRYIWPLLLQAASHPLITLYCRAEVAHINGEKGSFKIQVLQHPQYIIDDLCTGCGRCEAECSATVTTLLDGQKITHSAIHAPLLGTKAVPSAYIIDRDGFAPCHVACPLGVNVQGFISLLSKGKIDKALALISEATPFSGILGRVCKHPCEENCNRAEVDTSVSIRALHRYAADNARGSIRYTRKSPAKSRGERVAIVGSGPAGLTAAWELTRRGYSPTVFESHGVVGGMLATGIPRFRLPKEVREREIEAIRNLGVDIRTGITVGRDLTFAYLRERGYKAFFLSIGAQHNNRLNIRGEELEGVVDCMSLLLTLNLMVEAFVGANIVIIGDGNSAIDSARAAIRKNKGKVSLLSWTVPEEVTAGEEELKEALQEGVEIKYRTVPVQILGEGGKVTGIRCQKTRLTEQIMANGRHLPEPIPDTDFVIDADHVVVAIGQSPNAPQLGMEGLEIDGSTGVIRANPLTLATSIKGVFAGGDCITGPNNVVEAMAAGLRAAESIDRYIQGYDLEAERSFESPPTAEIDLESKEIAPYERATMPVISLRRRRNSYEETTTGLSAEAAQIETQRCLNCALCSRCMECTTVCELDAVFHDDSVKCSEVAAELILRFPSDYSESNILADNAGLEVAAEGIHVVLPEDGGDSTSQLARAMAVALEAAIEIKPDNVEVKQTGAAAEMSEIIDHPYQSSEQLTAGNRLGVFLCRCGGSISSVIDFGNVTRRLSGLPGIACIQEISQACTEAGAREIADQVAEWQLDRVVLAACRCCNSGQVCYSCTDRRVFCQQYLDQHLILPHNTVVEFCNIREQCAWAHQDDPKGATLKAVEIISSGIARARLTQPMAIRGESISPSVLILGAGPVSVTAARALLSRGYLVELVTSCDPQVSNNGADETTKHAIEQLVEKGVTVRPWPVSLHLGGSPGNYEAVLEYSIKSERINAGAILVDIGELNEREPAMLGETFSSGLLARIISRSKESGLSNSVKVDLLRDITIGETGGIFILPPEVAELPDDQVLAGWATAARVSAYLEQVSVSPLAMAVDIDVKMCRGCGDCADICPYIEMRAREDGNLYAHVDKALCLGCGACVSICPTGAIAQPLQSDQQITSTLRSMLHPAPDIRWSPGGKSHPRMVVFCCNWDGWSCIETAVNSGLHYPAAVKVVKVSCLSRIHAGLILNAFEFGADGVMLLGCEPGSCNFDSAGESIISEYEKARIILKMLGVWEDRLTLVHLPAFDGDQFVSVVTEFLSQLEKIPYAKRMIVAASEPA
ncbi:FAD-dependent oxidoreductase [Chloroflexota bacterium]